MSNLTFLNSPLFDHGAITQINGVLRDLSVKRPLICTDPGLAKSPLMDALREALSNEFGFELFAEVPPNPTEDAVDQAIARYRDGGCDSVIGYGGGSSIDLSKAVAVLATHPGEIHEYEMGGKPIEDVAPVVAIPTTAGTGSEVSYGSVLVMRSGRKVILASEHLLPKAAICDPDLTLGLPPHLTAGTGMDAVTHCIEAVLSPAINPPAEAVGLDGVERAVGGGALEKAVREGSDKQARWEMMMAATEGALAFTKGLGVVHAMSHACGAKRELGLHHGTLNGVILPHILRFNKGHVSDDKYARIARAMHLAANADLADHIERLNENIGLPPNLGAMGVTAEMVPGLIQHCQTDLCHFMAPRPPSPEEYEELFRVAIG